MTEFRFKKNTFLLFPEKGVYWKEKNILLIADVHIGKTAAFRSSGIPLPGGTTTENFLRLSLLVEKTKPEHLIIIGDLIHSKRGKTEKTIGALIQWRNNNKDIRFTLVSGNHDKRSALQSEEFDIEIVDDFLEISPFIFSHNVFPSDGKYLISGHVHPSVWLRGKGRESLRLPCFYFGKEHAILPSFGEFTGTYIIEPKKGDKVFVIAGNEVIQVKNKN